MSQARVLVVGSANVDFTVAVPRLPAPGETVSEGTLLVNHGGKGANQAVAARRLGADTRLIACVGQDASGERVRGALAAEGVGVDGVRTAPAATGTALIVVDDEGRNQIAVAPGANRALAVDHLRARRDDFAWAQVVICSLEVPLETVGEALALARSGGAVTILNPAPVPPRALAGWRLVDYLTPNEHEALHLAGRPTVGEAAQTLLGRGVGTVIVTMGAGGALVCDAGGVERIPAFRVAVIDTTAAGDAFNAGLAVALAERRRSLVRPSGEVATHGALATPGQGDARDRPALLDALRFASAAAALACTRRGAQDSLAGRPEVDRLLGR